MVPPDLSQVNQTKITMIGENEELNPRARATNFLCAEYNKKKQN